MLRQSSRSSSTSRSSKQKEPNPEVPDIKVTVKTDIDEDDMKKTGFNRGFVAEKILGATDASGELEYLIQWKGFNGEGSGLADLVPAREARMKCPDLIITFYEQRLAFTYKK